MAVRKFDPEHDLTAADLVALRGPYLQRPGAGAAPADWLRWASEVAAAAPVAQRLLDAAEAKAGGRGVGPAAMVTRRTTRREAWQCRCA